MEFTRIGRTATLLALAGTLVFAAEPAQEMHLVSPAELHQEAVAASQLRTERIQELTRLLGSEDAAKALKRARMDPQQVVRAVPFLTDDELAGLSARAGQAQKDFAAGSLTNEQLTYIVIALATAVIVILVVR